MKRRVVRLSEHEEYWDLRGKGKSCTGTQKPCQEVEGA
jgi:hypothetical protein